MDIESLFKLANALLSLADVTKQKQSICITQYFQELACLFGRFFHFVKVNFDAHKLIQPIHLPSKDNSTLYLFI